MHSPSRLSKILLLSGYGPWRIIILQKALEWMYNPIHYECMDVIVGHGKKISLSGILMEISVQWPSPQQSLQEKALITLFKAFAISLFVIHLWWFQRAPIYKGTRECDVEDLHHSQTLDVKVLIHSNLILSYATFY